MALEGANDNDKLACLGGRTYKEQGIWFLNAYFDSMGGAELGETIWQFAFKMAELDKAKGVEGNELDEFGAHRFLEAFGETLSVVEMRNALKEIDLDFNKRVSLVEYLVFKYKGEVTINGLVNANQGDKAEVEKASALLEAAQNALKVAKEGAALSKEAEATAKASAADAKKAEAAAAASAEEARLAKETAENAEASAKAAEAEATATETDAVEKQETAKKSETAAKEAEGVAESSDKAAREAEFIANGDAQKAESAAKLATAADNENKRCLADLHREEDEFNGKIAKFEAISTDPSLGVVKKNIAVNQLAQLKAEDPLPLRRAKISQSAAVRKSDIAAKKALTASLKAASTLKNATEAREIAEKELALAVQARSDAEAALKAAVAARKEAKAALDVSVKARQEAELKLGEATEAKGEADAALEASVRAREMAEADLAASVAAREAADTQLDEAKEAFATAEAYLTEVKSKKGSSEGALWWIDRDLLEARKYLPYRAGGIAR